MEIHVGPEVAELEDRLAAYGTGFCVGCANGTDALQIALMALNVGVGDEVITPSFSYIATPRPLRCWARPVYVDIDEILLAVPPVEAAITPRTKAIIPVSLYGQPMGTTVLTQSRTNMVCR